MPAIKTDNLTRAFGPLLAVDRLNLEVRPEEIFGLVGPDGSGKTTIMRMFSGILPATGGEAFILGHSIKKEAERIKDRIGYMSQRFALYGDLTVLENIHFYADLYAVPKKSVPSESPGSFLSAISPPFRIAWLKTFPAA